MGLCGRLAGALGRWAAPVTIVMFAAYFAKGAYAQQRIERKNEGIQFASFLPSGMLVTAGYFDNEFIGGNFLLSLWNPDTGERLYDREHERELEMFNVSSDGQLAASWDAMRTDELCDGSVRLFSLKPSGDFGSQIGVLGGETAEVLEVEFSPDNRFCAVSRSGDGLPLLRLFELKSLREVASSGKETEDGKWLEELGFSEDGAWLMAKQGDDVYCWSVPELKRVGKMKGHEILSESERSGSHAKFSIALREYAVRDHRKHFGLRQEISRVDAETAGGKFVFRDRLSSLTLCTVKQVERKPAAGVPLLEIDYKWKGLHAVSPDGKYAVVDSTLVNIEDCGLKNLLGTPDPDVMTYEVETAK